MRVFSCMFSFLKKCFKNEVDCSLVPWVSWFPGNYTYKWRDAQISEIRNAPAMLRNLNAGTHEIKGAKVGLKTLHLISIFVLSYTSRRICGPKPKDLNPQNPSAHILLLRKQGTYVRELLLPKLLQDLHILRIRIGLRIVLDFRQPLRLNPRRLEGIGFRV